MAYDYALVHLKYTIPLATFLSILIYPFITRTNAVQIIGIILIAFFATVPWDSHLIKTGVWTYPPGAVLGPVWLGIPIEELFFFFIQTYITSVIYLLFGKPLLHAQYLVPGRAARIGRLVGLGLLALTWLFGCLLWLRGSKTTYLGIILAWAIPFASIGWFYSGAFFLSLPAVCFLGPILIPTFYLWVVDALALGRGTWAIAPATKLEIYVWGKLDLEEAVFFLLTNVLVVFGVAGSDHFLAVVDAFPSLFPQTTPPLSLRTMRLLSPSYKHDDERIRGIQQAVKRLEKKSRSFYLASATFTGRLRIDLVLLYSYCRVADDLVDDASSGEEASMWIDRLTRFLNLSYSDSPDEDRNDYIHQHFPAKFQSALLLLPVNALPPEPLYELLDGFRMDLAFHKHNMQGKDSRERVFPIDDGAELERYSACVAGTVGQLCVALINHHCNDGKALAHQAQLLDAARRMGIALQYVNIARDIGTDAAMGRVYLPTKWLAEAGLTPARVLDDPAAEAIAPLRTRLLDSAFELYRECRPTMRWLPAVARGPMIAAVENYMEIGRVLRETQYAGKPTQGRATVPLARRLRVSLQALLAQERNVDKGESQPLIPGRKPLW